MGAITSVTGRGLPLRGDDIDTDRIMPARFLRGISFDGLEQHVFEDDRSKPMHPYNRHPFDVSQYRGASVLIVNRNFGCGSSREHAPQGLHRWGIQAIIGESFAEIFFGNAGMIGMPCVTAAPADIERLMELVEKQPQAPLTIDLAAGLCDVAGFRCQVSVPPKVREAFITGAWDTTGMLLDHFEQVEQTADRLPYVHGF
ncbi:MAG TPA: 3-isopropylmalate dehydratase small subunit [Vicinamibacterales bacterium]|nr:3-isopropylmalate dehydratase small subunit [Vicinamibacterales bacterium]